MHNIGDEVALGKVPIPTTNLDGTTSKRHYPAKILIETGDTARKIKTGDQIIMATSDPEKLPLPDHDLLDLQFHLQRLSSMAAAAEAHESYEEDLDPPMASAKMDQWLESLPDENSFTGQF